jgi:uncharacterized membrane protein
MPSRDSVGLERKIEHRLFLLSVWSKGIAGLLETIGGFSAPFKSLGQIRNYSRAVI